MPFVAIVGRPNVGKSTLFNRIVGRRQAIVHDMPGLTRDRLEAEASWQNDRFMLVDTGGIEGDPNEKGIHTIERGVRLQASVAAETADVIILLVDAREGLTAADEAIAKMLRSNEDKVIVVVNKVDPPQDPDVACSEFYALGFKEILPISAEHGRGVGELMDMTVRLFPEGEHLPARDEEIRVAVVGRPNAGKSSLVNRLLSQERMIVSDVPGTTRDAIDAVVEHGDHRFRFIDTAGIRRKSRVEGIEYYGVNRALKALERADVGLLMIDAVEGIADQDIKIMALAERAGVAMMVLMNKWDAVEKTDRTFDEMVKRTREQMGRMGHVPFLSVSAKTGQRLDKLLDDVLEIRSRWTLHVSTSKLNRFLRDSITTTTVPSKGGKRLKAYYMTQKDVCPPRFMIFVNDKNLATKNFLRYLENRFRENFDLAGIPIRLIVRESE